MYITPLLHLNFDTGMCNPSFMKLILVTVLLSGSHYLP
jgi:hypothetical protein